MLAEIAAGAAVLYSVLEVGAFLGKQREFDLPKANKDDPSYIIQGNYFQYIFKQPCKHCEDSNIRANFRGYSYESTYPYIPRTYVLIHDCPGHYPKRRPEVISYDDVGERFERYHLWTEEPKSCFSRLVTGIDNFVRGHPEHRIQEGSRYSLRGVLGKVRDVVRNVVHDCQEAKLDAAHRKQMHAEPQSSGLFSDDEF